MKLLKQRVYFQVIFKDFDFGGRELSCKHRHRTLIGACTCKEKIMRLSKPDICFTRTIREWYEVKP